MARGFLLALCVAFSLVGALFIDVVGAQTTRSDPEPSGLGEALYLRDCGHCHGSNGEGTTRGVPLRASGAAGAHYYLSTGRMPIDNPEDRIERSAPAYTDIEIDELVDHVASLGTGPGIPEIHDDGDISRGGSLYRTHCAQCHGSSGVGVALAAGVTAPSLLESTPTQVAEALVVGPGAMPIFHPTVLGDEELSDVVAYVQGLQRESSHGGAPLARSGRLDELLVAWGAVLALIVAARAVARTQ